MPDRTDKDYAIEFGEYLARAAEQFRDCVQDTMSAHDTIADRWAGLNSAIHEFRKRATKAKLPATQP